MSVFCNDNLDGVVQSVDCAKDSGGMTCVFHTSTLRNQHEVKQWIAKMEGTDLLAESHSKKDPVLIVHSKYPQSQMISMLRDYGQALHLPKEEYKIEPWKWRGYTSIAGQTLQLISGLRGSKNKSDGAAIAGFAITNLTANAINIVFGKQEKDDPHQLKALKEHFNEEYKPHLAEGQYLLDPESERLSFRSVNKKETGLSHRAYDALKKHSVFFSESVLRTIGSVSLCFPFTKFGEGYKVLNRGGSGKELLHAIANENAVTFKVGLLMLTGKALVGFSKEKDPYNPKLPTTLDKIRQNITFPVSSLVEGTAATWMMIDRYKNQSMTYRGKTMPDYPGALGNAMFVGTYGFRLVADYGTRDVNVGELFAHISDSLAKMPQKEIPKALAKTAIELSHHFEDKEMEQDLDIASIYAAIATELKEYHHIDIFSDQPSPNVHEHKIAQNPQAAKSTLKHDIKPLAPSYEERSQLDDVGELMLG